MFDSLAAAAGGTVGVAGVGAWARVENAACARRLAASAEALEAQCSADGSAERDQWCLDNWDAVAAEIAAAQNVSHGVASHQLTVAMALRERLPRVAELFATGALSYRLVSAIVSRTRLVRDREAGRRLDAVIAADAVQWGALSVAKTDAAIDAWVDQIDPGALRRTENGSRGRHLDIVAGEDGSGLCYVQGQLCTDDGQVLDQRLLDMARGVCANDPRTIDQRRCDALAALGRGAHQLACACGDPHCPAAAATSPSTPTATVVHVVADARSLTEATPVQLHGPPPPTPPSAPPSGPPSPAGRAHTKPAVVIGAGIVPAPLLAAKLATTATTRLLVHPGAAPPEPRYTPSRALADFVRCRDLTCRFPGCDHPAYRCDVDHSIPYPVGPTCASNLSCLCRKHHLLKTYWGWSARQSPEGTIVWTAPSGQRYTTHPGSRLHFPTLCTPTAAVDPSMAMPPPATGLMMPRRTHTRHHNRQPTIQTQPPLNDTH